MVARKEGWEEGIVKEFGTDMYILQYLQWIINMDLLCNIGNFAQCYVTT